MLPHTFCHINGIGTKTERRLWQAGILQWRDWEDSGGISLPGRCQLEIPAIFEASAIALEDGDPVFFCDRLTANEQWRIFPHFRGQTAYIDIETTGLGRDAEITTIALYDGHQVFHYVNGRNLEDFVDDLEQYTVLVSYNGKGFDVPCIESYFKIKIEHAHIDLRFILARLGYKGGLKGCEKMMGIQRGALDGIDGYFAVLLWHQFQRYDDERALETLLAYNIEDTVNLERLLVSAYNINVDGTPFAEELRLPFPMPPPLPFQPDQSCVEKIRRRFTL